MADVLHDQEKKDEPAKWKRKKNAKGTKILFNEIDKNIHIQMTIGRSAGRDHLKNVAEDPLVS